jgi:alkaline phosphatase D
VIASEFCDTSITSLSLPQSGIEAARAFNPHVHYARGDQRGYMRFALDAKQLQMQVRVVDNALDPASGITTAARFVVDPAKPGARAT